MPERIVLIGIELKNIETGLELSSDISAMMDTHMETVLDELDGEGITIKKKSEEV